MTGTTLNGFYWCLTQIISTYQTNTGFLYIFYSVPINIMGAVHV